MKGGMPPPLVAERGREALLLPRPSRQTSTIQWRNHQVISSHLHLGSSSESSPLLPSLECPTHRHPTWKTPERARSSAVGARRGVRRPRSPCSCWHSYTTSAKCWDYRPPILLSHSCNLSVPSSASQPNPFPLSAGVRCECPLVWQIYKREGVREERPYSLCTSFFRRRPRRLTVLH